MTNLYDLLDTAVKIGMGATITALTTYLITRLKFKNQQEDIQQERHRGLLEDVAKHAEEVNHVYLKYWEMMLEYTHALQSGFEWPQNRRNELFLIIDELVLVFNELTIAESKLLLLGEKAVYRSLRRYRHKVVQFRRNFSVDKKQLSESEAQDMKKEISEAREQFYEALSKRYRES